MLISMKFRGYKFYISYEFFDIIKISFDFSLLVDFYSLFFSSRVCFISRAVVFYSYNYMYEDGYFTRFHVILISFVASIIALIYGINIVSVILG